MAKLSVYNTIDRSQLGGKFVPLIQSGVNNYKILASDLGKEYSPGDAIEITDTGVINVNYDPCTIKMHGSGIGVRTDSAKGVFRGGNGIYIYSADSSIGISNAGIKVNTPFLAGYGLRNQGGSLYVKSANNTISVDSNGLRVYYGDGLTQDVHGRLVLHDGYLSKYATVRAGHGLYWYRPGYDDSALYVKSANNSILARESGLYVHAYTLIDPTYLDITYSHTITVDTGSVARAITGTGLVTTNGAIGVNVNTATGLTINDNKLYLNAGNGLQTANNTVSVKSADDSIGVSYSGVKVNVKSGGGVAIGSEGLYLDSSIITPPSASLLAGEGLAVGSDNKLTVNLGPKGGIMFGPGGGALWVNPDDIAGYGLLGCGGNLYVKSADSSIDVGSGGVKVKIKSTYSGLGLHDDGLCVRPEDSSIEVITSSGGVKVNAGYGLETTSSGLYVKSADNSIGVTGSGVGVKLRSKGGIALAHDGLYLDSGAITLPSASSLAGDGLGTRNGELYVKTGPGLGINSYGYIYSASSTVGPGLELHSDNYIQVKSSDGSISVSSDGISVNLRNARYIGSGLTTQGGELAVKSADNSIDVSSNGIKVNIPSIAGGGLVEHVDGGMLQVLPADRTISVSTSGVSVKAGYGLSATSEGLYVKSADNSIVTSYDGIGVNVTSGGGILTGTNGLYVDSGKLAGRGLIAHVEQHNVKLNVNVGQYDLSSNNRSSNLLKIDTATNVLYVRGVDVTGIIGTNNTMTRQQDPNSYYHSFGVDVDYLFSTYTDQSTLVYRGNKLSVHLSRIAGDGLGYDSTRKAIYVTSGGSMLGVAVSTPNNTDAYADMGGVAIGESAVTGGANSIAIGRFIHLDSGSTESIAIGYTASAIGYGSVSLGARASSSANLSVAIGYNAKSSGGIAIGYEASASDGMMSLTVYHSSGTCFNYSYDKDGNLCYYHNSGNSYTRSWKNLLTPPNYSTAVSINTNTEYTADRPAYIAFNVYAGGTSGYVVEFIKNSVTVFNVGVLYGLTIYNIIPVSKGDKYKLNITDYGATNPAVYAYRIYPS